MTESQQVPSESAPKSLAVPGNAGSHEAGDKLLIAILSWGTVAAFAFGGWFVNPSTTHLIYTEEVNDVTVVREYDLISLRDDAQPATRIRGTGLLLFGLFGGIGWFIVVALLNYEFSRQQVKRTVPAKGVLIYAAVLALFFVVAVLKIVDLLDF